MRESTSDPSAVQPAPLVETFELERETKGAFRLHAVDDAGVPIEQADAVIGTLYIRKTALKGAAPKRVRVTVEILDD